MAANLIVGALIAGYVIFILYRGHKRKKSGLSGGCSCGCSCDSCSGCRDVTSGEEKEEYKQ